MTDQLTPDLEARLGQWLAGRAPAVVPDDFVERIASIPRAAARPRPVRPAGSFQVRRGTRPMLLAAALAALTLGMIAGGVFISSSRRDAQVPQTSVFPSAAPTAAVEPSPTSAAVRSPAPGVSAVLPAVIPDTVEHGTIDTPIGPARWAHLHGDPSTLPAFPPIALPDGTFGWLVRGGSGDACYNEPASKACTDPPSPSLSVSLDVLAAREARPLPIDAAEASLRVIGDQAWLVTTDPTSVWSSRDLRDWRRTDLSGLRSPGPASIDWTVEVSPQAVAGDSVVATVLFRAADPGRLLGYPGRNVRLSTSDTGQFVVVENRLRSAGGDLELGTIAVQVDPDGIRFIDGNGTETARVEGVGRDFAEQWSNAGEIRYDRIAALDGDTWSLADLPLTQPDAWPLIVPMDDATLIVAVGPDHRVRVWRTTDGQTWTGGVPAEDALGKRLSSDGVTSAESADGTTIIAFESGGAVEWRSTDGQTWATYPESQSAGSPAAVKFDHGWFRTIDQTQDTWQASRDDTTWADVPALFGVITKTEPDGAGGTTEYAIGDTVFFEVEEAVGSRTHDVWMIEFGPPGS